MIRKSTFCFFLFLGAILFADEKPIFNELQNATVMDIFYDGRLLIAQADGHIFVSNSNSLSLWLDLSDSTLDSGAGILGLAIDHDFKNNGYAYVSQRAKKGDKIILRLLRIKESSTGTVCVDKILYDNVFSGPRNLGGRVYEGPDNCLYWGIGDSGVSKSAQDLNSLNGCVLRLTRDGLIPEDNPFANSPVWAYGFRDPQGIAWRDDGVACILDKGPTVVKGTKDELNLLQRGKNYGWPIVTGRDWVEGIETPIVYCNSGHSWAPTGALFMKNGDWKGSLLFTGTGEDILYHLNLSEKNPDKVLFLAEEYAHEFGPMQDLAQTSDGYLYLLTDSRVYKINPQD